jgi:hypothetical protein
VLKPNKLLSIIEIMGIIEAASPVLPLRRHHAPEPSVLAEVTESAAQTPPKPTWDGAMISALRGPGLVTMTPLTPFQRTALTMFIYNAAQRALSPELLSDTHPPSDQDLLGLALLSAARVEMSDSDTTDLFCGVLEISYADFLEATEFFHSRWSIVAYGNN